MRYLTRSIIAKLIDKFSFFRAYESTIKEMESKYDNISVSNNIQWIVNDQGAKGTRLFDNTD